MSRTPSPAPRDGAAGRRPDSILSDIAVSLLTTLPRDVLVSLAHHGHFPRAVALTSGGVGWRQSEVQDWIASLPHVGERP